jgi:hypothetical protein
MRLQGRKARWAVTAVGLAMAVRQRGHFRLSPNLTALGDGQGDVVVLIVGAEAADVVNHRCDDALRT